jgi:hypothetical protein
LHESRKTDPETEHFCGVGVAKTVRGDRSRATGSCGGISQGFKEAVIRATRATTRQQEAFRSGQKFRPGQRAQGQNALNDAPNLGIDGNEAFGVQLAEGDVERPLIRPNLA